MQDHAVIAVATTLVAVAFACSTLERWRDKRAPHELAWTVALGCFALAAGSLWWGEAMGWGEGSFRVFYAFGAVVNVPVLALGTVLLLAPRTAGRAAAVGVGLFAAFGAGVVAAAPLRAPVPADRLPQGSDVFGVLPRVLAAVGSGAGAIVLFVGAALTVGRLARRRTGARLAAANVCIAAGTVVLSLGGVLNSVVDAMTGFAITLLAGVVLLFAGFLIAGTGRRPAVSSPAHHPGSPAERAATRPRSVA